MDIITIDFLKVDKAACGYEYILIIIDQFTRYAQAYATTNRSAKNAAEKLFNDFLCWNSERQIESYTTKERNAKTNCLIN